MTGFGTSAMGSAPFGIGTPADAPEALGLSAGSRYLNPATGDYEVDTTTQHFAQMPPTRQRVLLALLTRHNSSAVDGFGKRVSKRMGDSFEVEERAHVAEALHHMTEVEKVLRVNQVDVERGLGGRARVTVHYTDLVSGEADLANTDG
jgi:hypothetical protein